MLVHVESSMFMDGQTCLWKMLRFNDMEVHRLPCESIISHQWQWAIRLGCFWECTRCTALKLPPVKHLWDLGVGQLPIFPTTTSLFPQISLIWSCPCYLSWSSTINCNMSDQCLNIRISQWLLSLLTWEDILNFLWELTWVIAEPSLHGPWKCLFAHIFRFLVSCHQTETFLNACDYGVQNYPQTTKYS